MAFASSMGGMLTLIGTPPNLVVNNQLQEAGLEGLGFFSFTPIGIVCIVTGVLVLIPLSRKFLGERGEEPQYEAKGKSLSQLIDEYQIIGNLYRLRVLEDSELTEHPGPLPCEHCGGAPQAFRPPFLSADGQPDHGGVRYAGEEGGCDLRDGRV